jgi:hypothetical protein
MIRRFLFVLLLLTISGNVMADPLYGRENLAAFFAAQVRARANGTPIKIHIFGDSKVAGIGVTDGYRLDQLLAEYASRVGYPVIVTYEGFGGQNSYLWANNEDNDFVLEHPDVDLLIVDIGTNEGYLGGATGGPQTEAETKANLLAADARIRLSRSHSSLSILYLGQTPANNWATAYNQTTERMQVVNGIMKEVAEETNAGYFDTLQLFTRAHAEAGWMEQLPTPQYGDGNVHPGNPLNLVLTGELGKALFTMPLKLLVGAEGLCTPALQNGWSAWTAPAATYTPRAKLKDGVVTLDGLIKPGTMATQTILFSLPSGFRPPVNRFFTVSVNNTGGSRTVQILSGGAVRLGGDFAGDFLSLDGISFRVD